jgi:autotransporter-associated beta strand protein
MSWRLVGAASAALAMCNPVVGARAQSALQIPLNFNADGSRLIINVGIGGGTPLPYLFDTGSAMFNATYNPAAWGTVGAASPNAVPTSQVKNGNAVEYGYVSGGKYFGNILQVQNLSFAATPGGPAVASLSAPVGFQLNAIYQHTIPGDPTQNFPSYFAPNSPTKNQPPIEQIFYGTFGAGNFVSANGPTGAQYVSGGILGQASLPGLIPGYVVAANGQANAFSVPTVSGTQQVTSCSPCVILGLTPALIGQFANVYQVTPSNQFFPNPYSATSAGNGSANSFGGNLLVTLTPPGGSASQAVALTVGGAGGLLDTGTTSFILNTASLASLPASLGTISSGKFAVNGGSTLSVSGITSTQLPASTTTLVAAGGPNSAIYSANVGTDTNPATGTHTATIGLSFFLQNSVLYDLQNNVIGYTPFFVSSNDISTTNGPLTVNSTSVPVGLAGVVSGPGGIAVGGGGMLQLSANNTFTGPTTIASGATLLVSGPGSIGQSSGVTNNGFFDISGAWGPVAVQGLNGSGRVNLGGQALVINGNGSYSGTLVDGGRYGGTAGSVNIAGGTQVFGGTSSYSGPTTVSGGALVVNGSLSNSTVLVGSQGSLVVNGSIGAGLVNGGTATIAGTVAGSALNSGMLTVNGTVAGGVANMGALGGSGLIGGNLINTGMVGPGNSIGTLSVGGNFTQTASGTYSVEANGAGQSDLINVGGTATLQGGSVSVYAQPGSTFAPRTTYRILNATGGLSGTFASVTDPYPFLLPSLSYDANNVYLNLVVGGFAAAAATPTQAAVGNALDANVNTASGDFANVLSAMATNTFSNAQAQATLQAISGNNYAGFSTSMVQGMQLFMNNFANQSGGAGSPMSNRVALAEACDVACDTITPPKWGAWGGALGGLGTVGAGQPVGTVTYNAGGFAAGLDRLVTDTFRMGVTAGYSTGTQWVGGFDGLGRSNTFQVGLYGGFAQDKVYADGLIGYAYTQNQMWRNIPIPGLQPRTAYGNTGANQWYGQLETGYRFDIGTNANAFVTPFARLQAYTANQNAFTETGAQSLNLSIAQQQTNSLRSVIGAQLGGSMDLGWREKLFAQLRLGWSHEYADVGRPVTATLAGAPAMPFTTWGVSPQRDGVVIGVSANTAVAEATSIYLRYEGNISGQDSAHAITAGVRMTW